MPRGVYDRSKARPRVKRKLANWLSIDELQRLIDNKTRTVKKLSRRRLRVEKKLRVVDRQIGKLVGRS